MKSTENHKKIKTIFDLTSLVAFFLVYKLYGIYSATIVLIAATIITTFISYHYERRISWTPVIILAVVIIMGGLTLWLKDDTFIKIKPTIINIAFASVLLVGLFLKKNFLQYLLGESIKMPEIAWRKFTYRWMGLFLFLATANEIVWRNFSTDVWVDFKVFGILGITILFMMSQYSFLKTHGKIEQ